MSVIKNYILPHPPIMIPQIGKGGRGKCRINYKSYFKYNR